MKKYRLKAKFGDPLKLASFASLEYFENNFTADPNTGDLRSGPTGTPPKLGWNRGGVRSTKNLQYLRNGARYDRGYL